MCQKIWAGVSPSLPIPKLTQYIQFVKSGQKIWEGPYPHPLIWTKSKRTATFFGKPSLSYPAKWSFSFILGHLHSASAVERLREFWADIVSAALIVVGSNKTIQYLSNIFTIQSLPKTVGLHTATATYSCDDLDHWIGWSQGIGLDMKWILLLKCRWRTIFVSGLMEPPAIWDQRSNFHRWQKRRWSVHLIYAIYLNQTPL